MKRIFKLILIFSLIWLLGSLALYRQCNKPLPEVDKNDYLLPSDTYRPPIIKLPFTKDKAPVKEKFLPIPKKDVKTTIVIKDPGSGTGKVTIIIDKKGKIYKSTDTPEDVKIEVTHWKPKLFEIKPRFSYVLAYRDQVYHCLSLNVLRVGKFYLGGEVGVSMSDYDFDGYLLGVSGKYHFMTLDFATGQKITAFAVLGYDFLCKKAYVGIMLRF